VFIVNFVFAIFSNEDFGRPSAQMSIFDLPVARH